MATEGMSSSEQSLIYGFLLNALIRTEKANVLRAGRRASSLLRRVLDLDEAALREVTALCNTADTWQGWQDSTGQVRSAISGHLARGRTGVGAKGAGGGAAAPGGEAQDLEALGPDWWAEYERRFLAYETAAAREATELELLDTWAAQTSRPLGEFLGLWDAEPDPEGEAEPE